jgi:hypothetical protein
MLRKALWLGVLLLAPLAVYWQTVFHEFGFRDDYALLREVHEEPGKVLRLTISNGRPVQGLALDASLGALRDVTDLQWVRLLTVVLLAAVAAVLFRALRKAGWSSAEAGAIALGIALLPGAQVIVGWAISWPLALALLFAVLGFVVVEAQLRRSGSPRLGSLRIAALAGGASLYFLAALTYQSNALFVVVPLAALLLVRGDHERLGHARWVATHFAILFGSLAAAYLLTQLFFAEGGIPEAARMQLEPNLLPKLWWFVRQPLVNSVALFELRDRFDTSAWFWVVAAIFGAILALGFRFGAPDRSHKLRWLFCLLCLPFVGHAVSIIASSQAIGYRTVFSVSGLMLVLVVFALRSVVQVGRIRPKLQYAVFAVVLAFAAASAYRNAYTLIAEPQNREWELFQDAAQALRLDADTDVYIVRPGIDDRSTEQIFDDEFGSLSSDADWASKEMFKAAMRERFPDKLPAGVAFSIVTGAAPPASPAAYDAVIDLRKLRHEGDRELTVAGDASPAARR